MRPPSAATTPGQRRRSRAWSSRMNPSRARGSSRRTEALLTAGSVPRRVLSYLKRLATAGAAYQAADIISRVFAVITLPVYTRALTSADYGNAETLVAGVVLL